MKKIFTNLILLNLLIVIAGCSASNSAFLNQKIRLQNHSSDVSKTDVEKVKLQVKQDLNTKIIQPDVSLSKGDLSSHDQGNFRTEKSSFTGNPALIQPKKVEKSSLMSVANPKIIKTESQLKQKNSNVYSVDKQRNQDDTDLILMIVLCFFIPPLAVFLKEGQKWTERCTLNLILTFLCGVPGMIHALIVVTGK